VHEPALGSPEDSWRAAHTWGRRLGTHHIASPETTPTAASAHVEDVPHESPRGSRGVTRSTARGWLGVGPTVVMSLDVVDLTGPELRQEILKLRRRVQKLTALLRLVLTLLRASRFTLSREQLPDGDDKRRIPGAVDRARACIPLRAVLRFLHMSPSRFHAWRRLKIACALDDRSSCPHTSPHRLTSPEVQAIRDMVTSPEYRHVPTGTLAVLAQRLGQDWASPSTW
jgi:hypothetical protein